jgi:hypothetical protein
MMRLWNDIVRTFPVRVELPFALGPAEFRGQPPRHIWDVSVAGAPYRTRVIASGAIRAAGLSLAPYRELRMTMSALDRILPYLLPAEGASMATIRLQQKSQRQMMASTPVSFVCGSGLAFAVRKFFETPAMQNAMVAMPCVGFEDLGFRDGEHAIVAAPDDAGHHARRLVNDADVRQRIAGGGFDLVRREHSTARRADQLIDCMQRLGRDQLKNAQYVRGRFEVV